MSAAATAAGYLYASGRLRGKQSKEHDEHERHEKQHPGAQTPRREEVRVAALPSPEDTRKPKRQPTIQYRTRRWRPDDPAKAE